MTSTTPQGGGHEVLQSPDCAAGIGTADLVPAHLSHSTLQELIAGGAAILVILFIPLPGIDVLGDLRWTPRAFIYGIGYVFYFLWELVKANLDVAFRVLHPSLPIEPGVVKVKTRLKTRLGRLLLANSITLTPGTITMEVDGEDFYVHWIKVQGVHDKERTKKSLRVLNGIWR